MDCYEKKSDHRKFIRYALRNLQTNEGINLSCTKNFLYRIGSFFLKKCLLDFLALMHEKSSLLKKKTFFHGFLQNSPWCTNRNLFMDLFIHFLNKILQGLFGHFPGSLQENLPKISSKIYPRIFTRHSLTDSSKVSYSSI